MFYVPLRRLGFRVKAMIFPNIWRRTGERTIPRRTCLGDHLTIRGLRARRFGLAARPGLPDSIATTSASLRRHVLRQNVIKYNRSGALYVLIKPRCTLLPFMRSWFHPLSSWCFPPSVTLSYCDPLFTKFNLPRLGNSSLSSSLPNSRSTSSSSCWEWMWI